GGPHPPPSPDQAEREQIVDDAKYLTRAPKYERSCFGTRAALGPRNSGLGTGTLDAWPYATLNGRHGLRCASPPVVGMAIMSGCATSCARSSSTRSAKRLAAPTSAIAGAAGRLRS